MVTVTPYHPLSTNFYIYSFYYIDDFRLRFEKPGDSQQNSVSLHDD